jgi:hypothetical protein
MKDLLLDEIDALEVPSDQQKTRIIEKSQKVRALVRKWKMDEPCYDTGGDISIGLKYYFSHKVKQAKGNTRGQNTILSARYLLEQYVLLGLEQGPRPYATDQFMMRITGLSKDRFQSAKRWLKRQELISVERTHTDGGQIKKCYVKINVLTNPSLRGAINSIDNDWDGDDDERYGEDSWEIENQDDVLEAIEDYLTVSSKSGDEYYQKPDMPTSGSNTSNACQVSMPVPDAPQSLPLPSSCYQEERL